MRGGGGGVAYFPFTIIFLFWQMVSEVLVQNKIIKAFFKYFLFIYTFISYEE